MDNVSVIIPALNEEAILPATLDAVNTAIQAAQSDSISTEVLVVDNGSTDRTSDIARARGVRVIKAEQRNVAAARNAGARAAFGDILIFVDADTHWPTPVFRRILETMRRPGCIGGAVHAEHRPAKRLIRHYLVLWKLIGNMFQMAQGATQFCTSAGFNSIGGYDESIFMGEDVEFYSRLRAFARSNGRHVMFVQGEVVVPSSRKFDTWPVWKTILVTNPLTCLLFSRSRWPWGNWYTRPTR